MSKGTHSYHLDKYSIYWWISWGARHIPEPLANFIGDRIADWLYAYKSRGIVEEQVRNLDVILGSDVSIKDKRRWQKACSTRRWGRRLRCRGYTASARPSCR